MQFCTEITPPQSRDLCTVEQVTQAAAGNGEPGQGVTLPTPAEVARLITAASAMIENHLRRVGQLLQTKYREALPGTGGTTIMLSVTPVLQIDTVTLRGQPFIRDWILNHVTGVLYLESGWDYTGQVWRDIEDTRLPAPGAPVLVVDYTAGYRSSAFGELNDELDEDILQPPLPADIEQACVLTVLQWLQTQNRDLTIQRTRIGDFTQTFFSGTSNVGGVRGLPIPVVDMLTPYRRLD